MTPMPSPLHVLLADLDADRASLRAAVERVPVPLRGHRTAPDRWSIAEVLEHLAVVEQRAAPMVDALVAAAPPREPAGEAPAPLDRTVLRDRSERVPAPEPLHPTGRWGSADEAWAALEQSRAALLDALRGAEGRDLAAVTRVHPRLGVLTGYQWIAALGGHEARHAAQIHEIADALASSEAERDR
jgi:hypothetical protein